MTLLTLGLGAICLTSCSTTPGDAAARGAHFTQAAKLYESGANQGDALAATKLGDLYYYQPGLPKNHQKALFWYEKAVTLGNPAPLYLIGLIYRDGTNEARPDMVRARLWFERGAELGQHYSMYALADLYASGAIGPGDDVRGMMWLIAVSELASTHSPQNEGTRWILSDPKLVKVRLQDRMSPADQDRAHEMARDWVKAFLKRNPHG